MSKHTKGPWHCGPPGDFSVNAANGHGICSVLSYIDDPGFGNKEFEIDSEANARVIAAAPELLASCKELLEVNKHLMQVIYVLGTCGGGTEVLDEVFDDKHDGFGVRAQKAIERAEGKETENVENG